jgi:hypothetical protein
MILLNSSYLIRGVVGLLLLWTSVKTRLLTAFKQTTSGWVIRRPLMAVDNFLETIHSCSGSGIISMCAADLVTGVNDGRMVAPKCGGDHRERLTAALAGEVHGDLARPGHAPRAVGAEQLLDAELEVLRHRRLNLGDRNLWGVMLGLR